MSNSSTKDSHSNTPGSVIFPQQANLFGGGGSAAGVVHRSENSIIDCEVVGTIPANLNGTFYRVGPDPQYPKSAQNENDILFDGEGHVSMFHIKDGHVDYRSRYIRTQRWKAQNEARRSLFGMYRNPQTDEPSVSGLSRGTANTQVFFHHGKLLAFKEDSPPVELDTHTLETINDYYTFNGALKGKTYTAHPKIDPITGDLIGFGYEAKGMASKDIEILSIDKHGSKNWHTWIEAPYACMLHDFAVTETHIAFLTIPLVPDIEQMNAGGLHFSWDSTLPSYLGVLARGSEGKTIRWFKGSGVMCTHTMGAWSEGSKLYWDMDGAEGNQFPFFPNKHEPWDPIKAMGQIRRFSVDLDAAKDESFTMEVIHPEVSGVLARQDDRYHTLPYRYGFLMNVGPDGNKWSMIDHQTGDISVYDPGEGSTVSEMCFVPRSKDAPEGDGYLIGVVTRLTENNRSDVVLVDTKNFQAGPVATIKLPYKIVGQVHGFWAASE